MAIKNSDLQYIEQALGRKPRGILEVSVRSKDGKPVVVKTKPLIDNEIFPTLYYLVDKRLIEDVSRLENEGLLADLQQEIYNNSDLRQKFLEAQNDYINERNSLIHMHLLSKSQKEALETGIGGVNDLTRIKCLHCHLAHYLATENNPVGREIYYTIGSEIREPVLSPKGA